MPAMTGDEDSTPGRQAAAAAQGRQVLFYAAAGLLGGTFTCSRCGASGSQPDVIDHAGKCAYARPGRLGGVDGRAR